MIKYQLLHQNDELEIGKIICLAQTYQKHAEEMESNPHKEPILFLKPKSSIIFNNDTIILPPQSQSIHHEIELGIVIGKKGSNISESKAIDHIYGYLLALDLTARDIQSEAKKHGWPWSIPKGFDTFCPISEVIKKSVFPDPTSVELKLLVNGELRQHGTTKDLIFTLPFIISFISKIMTLEKGDLILTGTPEGVNEIKDGDVLKASINNILKLEHTVKRIKN
jgi:acylpyruvate hydrolase